MPRVFLKKKNRGGTKVYLCSKCGKPIVSGQEYLTWKFNRGDRFFRHGTCGPPRRSELSPSKMGGVWDAVDDFNVSGEGIDDIKQSLSTVAEAARSVSEQYQEAAANILSAWTAGNPTSEACQDTASALDDWADRLEGWEPQNGRPVDGDEETVEDWLEQCRDEAQDLVNDQPEYQG